MGLEIYRCTLNCKSLSSGLEPFGWDVSFDRWAIIPSFQHQNIAVQYEDRKDLPC